MAIDEHKHAYLSTHCPHCDSCIRLCFEVAEEWFYRQEPMSCPFCLGQISIHVVEDDD